MADTAFAGLFGQVAAAPYPFDLAGGNCGGAGLETSHRLAQTGADGQQAGDRHHDAPEDLAHHLRAWLP